MSNTVKHKKNVATPPTGPGKVGGTEWIDEHAFSGGANRNVLLRDTGQSDGVSWLSQPDPGVAAVLLATHSVTLWTDRPAITSLQLTEGLQCSTIQTTASGQIGGFQLGNDAQIDFPHNPMMFVPTTQADEDSFIFIMTQTANPSYTHFDWGIQTHLNQFGSGVDGRIMFFGWNIKAVDKLTYNANPTVSWRDDSSLPAFAMTLDLLDIPGPGTDENFEFALKYLSKFNTPQKFFRFRCRTDTDSGGQLVIDAEQVTIGGPNSTDLLQLGDGAEIIWGRPPATVGVGATATLGKIGGSGPTSAAQVEWLRVKDANGQTGYIPVWM